MITAAFNLVMGFFNNIKWTPLKVSIGVNIIMGVIILFLTAQPIKQDPVYIIEDRVVLVPEKHGSFDIITPPVPIINNSPTINKNLLEDYRALKDSLTKEEVYIEAITENEYSETYEDSLVKIDVYTKVRGKLLKQSPSYTVKPFAIKYRDTTIIEKYEPTINIYGGVEAGIPMTEGETIGKGTFYFQNKKQNIISLGVDTKGYVWGGYIIKL